jgi:hypothetical protein
VRYLALAILPLLLLPASVPAQKGKRCLPELARASNQLRRVEQFGNNVTVFIGGNVLFRCQGQNVQVGGDSVQIINDNIYMFIGHAFYRDSALAVGADTLTYFKHASNPQQDETVQARRNVKVTDRKTGSTLTAPSVDFMRGVKGIRDSDDVQASGRPVVRYLPTASGKNAPPPKPWTITAEHLRGFGQTRLWGGGTVIVDRDSLRVNSDSLDVESGKTRVTSFIGKPATLRRIGGDSLLIKGKLIRLGFTGDTLRAIRAFGTGEVIRGTSTITGDSILVGYEREKVTRTDVWSTDGKSRVLSNGYDATGDSLVIETPGEQLKALRAFRTAALISPIDTLHPILIDSAEGGPPGRDTLWGNRLLAAFEERDSAGTKVTRISQVRAYGDARSWYSYNAGAKGQNCPALTYSLADTIVVRMKSGDSTGIADVQYHGHVHVYTADKTTAQKTVGDSVKSSNSCRGTKR